MRLFIGIEFDEAVKARFAKAQDALGEYAAKGVPVPQDNFHLTLCFLGEIDEDDIVAVEDTLDDIRSDARFDLVFDHVGTFSGRGRKGDAQTWWLGCWQNKRLEHLQAEIENAMRKLGVELDDRAFTPHVTLAKNVKLAKDASEKAADEAVLPEPVTARVTAFSLIESTQVDGETRYQTICSWE